MGYPDDLLSQAYHLATREPKNPRQASLRRAVSTGYYALFHLLIDEAVSQWAVEHQRSAIGRSFEHRTMKMVCADYVRSFYEAGAPEAGAKLKGIAQAFMTLQQKRHIADYDNGVQWHRKDVLGLLDMVSDAFKDWRVIRDQRDAQDFLIQLLLPRVFKLREGDLPGKA
jgi:hypothetical protein